MARPRLPQAKAEVSGAVAKNAGRFADRKAPKVKALGLPPKELTENQKTAWVEISSSLPWLDNSHRVILELACRLVAKMRENPEFGVNAIQALSSLMSKLGATPVDATKITYDPGDSEEPEDKFFGRSN
jgi:hypothetical protein